MKAFILIPRSPDAEKPQEGKFTAVWHHCGLRFAGSLWFCWAIFGVLACPLFLGVRWLLHSQALCRHNHVQLKQPRSVKRLFLLVYFFTSDINLFRSPTEDSVSHSPGLWQITSHPLKHKAEGEWKSETGCTWGKEKGNGSRAGNRQCLRHSQRVRSSTCWWWANQLLHVRTRDFELSEHFCEIF